MCETVNRKVFKLYLLRNVSDIKAMKSKLRLEFKIIKES